MNMLCVPLILASVVIVPVQPDPKKPVDNDLKTDYEAKLNDILSKGITPEKNANVLLWKALGPTPEGGTGMPAEFFKRLGIPEPPKQGDYFVGSSVFIRDHLKLKDEDLTAYFAQESLAYKQTWSAKDYPRIAQWLSLNEKPLAVVIEATKRPEYYNPLVAGRSKQGERGTLIGAPLSNVQKCRELVAALCGRAMLRVEEGKFDEAWQDLLAAHRLGRLVTRGATFIEALVGIAIGAVAHNATVAYLDRVKLTPKQLADHLKDLQALPPRRTMADTIDIGERHLGLDALQHIRRGGGDFDNLIPGNQPTAADLKALGMIDWDTALGIVTSSYNKMAAAMRVPDRAAREKAFDKLEKDLDSQVKEAKKAQELLKKQPRGGDVGKIVAQSIAGTLMGLLTPAVRKLHGAYDRAEQLDRNLHIAFAMAAFHRDTGRYPAKLDDLAPKYLATVPNDLFTGKPLIYKPTSKGYLFYSVGVNGKDEAGRWVDDDPRGDDPRVRMPLPPLKRDP